MALLVVGCQGVAERSVRRLVYPRVCPVCQARSVDECHCFTAVENAGYCETNWASLDPTIGYAPQLPADPQYIEEIPTPEVLLSPETETENERESDARSLRETDVIKTVTHWDFKTEPSTRNRRQPISLRFDDKDVLISDD